MKQISLPVMDYQKVVDEIGDFIIERILVAGHSGAVIGLSGGVDSTVVAELAKRAIQKWNTPTQARPLSFVGFSLPSKVNNPDDAREVRVLASKIGIPLVTQSLDKIIEAFESSLGSLEGFDRGNMISRIRAVYLNTEASKRHSLLLGTGNRDEDFGIGYYTLFGDGAVHCSPIAGLSKRLVREMAVYLGFPDVAMKTPSAGLEIGQTDEGDLGYGYDAVEIVLEALEQGFAPSEIREHPQVLEIIQKYVGRKFETAECVVFDIVHRHQTSAVPKSRILHPPVPEITLVY
jgi:NAD+ synthase